MFRHLLSAVLLAGLSVAAHGHEVWVNAAHTHGGEVLKAELGYGHYPELEPIAADRLSLFPKPLQLLTPQGKIDLVRRGQHNYQFETPRAVADGSYLLLAQYRPTFWSRNAAGWQRQNLTQMKDATYCEQTSMFGKAVVNVGHESASKELISRPVGDLLEIVPLENPANVRVARCCRCGCCSVASRCRMPRWWPRLTVSPTATRPTNHTASSRRRSPTLPAPTAQWASSRCAKAAGKCAWCTKPIFPTKQCAASWLLMPR